MDSHLQAVPEHRVVRLWRRCKRWYVESCAMRATRPQHHHELKIALGEKVTPVVINHDVTPHDVDVALILKLIAHLRRARVELHAAGSTTPQPATLSSSITAHPRSSSNLGHCERSWRIADAWGPWMEPRVPISETALLHKLPDVDVPRTRALAELSA